MTQIKEKLVESLLETLESNDLVLVTFKTKSGTNRVMGCTKKLSAIPEESHGGRLDYRLNHESIMCVYDYQNSAWRSFRNDSVISFSVHS